MNAAWVRLQTDCYFILAGGYCKAGLRGRQGREADCRTEDPRTGSAKPSRESGQARSQVCSVHLKITLSIVIQDNF